MRPPRPSIILDDETRDAFVIDGEQIIVEAFVTGPLKHIRVRTAVSSEEGYLLHVAALEALGVAIPSFPVHVFDLGHDDIDGLLGLSFLSELNYEIRSAERRILVERIEP